VQCRDACGACCIAPSIRTSFYGMPEGKPAGQRCVHLTATLRCALFDDPRRPKACAAFAPEAAVCGATRDEALQLLSDLEHASAPEWCP